MSGSDFAALCFFNALPKMPGYIRGSARQRGRDALSTTSSFSTKNVATEALDIDDQETRKRGGITGEMETFEENSLFGMDPQTYVPTSFNTPVPEEENKESTARPLRGLGRADTLSMEEPTVFVRESTNPDVQRRAENRLLANPIRLQRDGHGLSLVVPRNYVVVFLLLVGFFIGLAYLTSRGNYFCIKLEIEGYGLS